tara:strand:+ start:30617 stop:32965 length:2349 start_codon:yes stop_codon:yes gene_type:complete
MKRTLTHLGVFMLMLMLSTSAWAQTENYNHNKFKQLKEELATPNVYRTAAGAPGHEYYQQKADYKMNITLDDENQKIYGEATVTYTNNSPDPLEYLWVQLDQNVRAPDSDTYKISTSSMRDRMTFGQIQRMHHVFDGGFHLDYVKDSRNNDLNVAVNKTMMRIDMDKPLKPGQSFTFKTKWWYNINNRLTDGGGRSGSEYFEEDDNFLYTIAQFYPRMAVYNDVEGWQNKQFLGRGEFTLTFGDFDVNITVPSDHLVAATGELQNAKSILPASKRKLLEDAKTADAPVIIYSQDEAIEREKTKATDTKTWKFSAKNVRDFGFASSRKFIWDAMGVKLGGKTVMAMSMYPKEGNPLWEQYSTRVVAHTVETYSKFTFDYPYPVAWSINAASIGMEYPMICFNFGRTEEDGTYSDRTKYGMIGVIIHEVGHNFFPMIVNSDERQWTWMDEGLNTFLQYLTEQEWERGFPSRRGPAPYIVNYMKGDKERISPIMTNSESIWQFGNNAYGKPATALNILRETVMGRELFDYAFKTYAQRWMFKHPTPADLFRTMEDASAVDLDWFWRGWFFTNWHVDQGIKEIKWYQIDTQNPEVEKAFQKAQDESAPVNISTIRDDQEKLVEETWLERDPAAADFYNNFDPYKVTLLDMQDYERFVSSLDEDEKALLNSGMNYYEITFENVGELVMPIIVQFTYKDGSTEVHKIPVEIWKMNDKEVTKVFFSEKEVVEVALDPFLEIADTDVSNNYWPARVIPTRFELYKGRGWGGGGENPMQRQRRADELEGGE